MNFGGAGTVFLLRTNGGFPQVFVDNGGQRGTNTTLGSSGPFDLTVSGGAAVNALVPSPALPPPLSLRNLLVASNSWITAFPNLYQGLQINVTSNATVQAGGGIIVDGGGSPRGVGLGSGGVTNTTSLGYTGGGGGYGGCRRYDAWGRWRNFCYGPYPY